MAVLIVHNPGVCVNNFHTVHTFWTSVNNDMKWLNFRKLFFMNQSQKRSSLHDSLVSVKISWTKLLMLKIVCSYFRSRLETLSQPLLLFLTFEILRIYTFLNLVCLLSRDQLLHLDLKLTSTLTPSQPNIITYTQPKFFTSESIL